MCFLDIGGVLLTDRWNHPARQLAATTFNLNLADMEERHLQAFVTYTTNHERTHIMLIKAKTLQGFKLQSRDGEIGKVRDFYFDDTYWTIRYLIADTGNWLMGRQVLISPYSLGSVSKAEQHLAVDLTRKQIEESPDLSSDKPVSKQFEASYYGYYGWPVYWGGPYMWGSYPAIPRDRNEWLKGTGILEAWDPSLRSTDAVTGYHIQATDGEIGHVEDFIIDDETWAIRYLVIDTRNWWPGKKVLVSPEWIQQVSWSDSKVFFNISREHIQQAPEYTDNSLLTRDYEAEFYRHYNREGYWVNEPIAPVPNVLG